LIDGVLYEVYGKLITRYLVEIDKFNPSSEETNEGSNEVVESGVDVVLNHHLMETYEFQIRNRLLCTSRSIHNTVSGQDDRERQYRGGRLQNQNQQSELNGFLIKLLAVGMWCLCEIGWVVILSGVNTVWLMFSAGNGSSAHEIQRPSVLHWRKYGYQRRHGGYA